MKKRWWIMVIMAWICFVMAGRSEYCMAAGVEGIPLKLNTDITQYDVTGDGKADSVRIESEKKIKKNEPSEGPWIIKINGVVAYRSDPQYYVEYLTVVLYPISEDTVYLNIKDEVGSNDDINSCAFYQYQSDTLKMVCDVFSPMVQHKSLMHIYVSSMKVNKNVIRVTYSNQFSVTGYLSWRAMFRQKNGVWKIDGDTYAVLKKKSLTANRTITLYRKPGGKGKAFTMKKGQKVKVDQICLKNKKAYIHMVLPDGTEGWMESPGKHYRDGYYFKEVVFAG